MLVKGTNVKKIKVFFDAIYFYDKEIKPAANTTAKLNIRLRISAEKYS